MRTQKHTPAPPLPFPSLPFPSLQLRVSLLRYRYYLSLITKPYTPHSVLASSASATPGLRDTGVPFQHRVDGAEVLRGKEPRRVELRRTHDVRQRRVEPAAPSPKLGYSLLG